MTSPEFSPHGFQIPRPVGLPASEQVWEQAEKYGSDSKAVSTAMCHALVELEDLIRSRP